MELLEQAPPLLEQFATGDLNAFESLFRQHQAEVYSWIMRIVRDPAAAEDLTIETFWRIYRAHARFEPDRSFGAWARRIATNVAIDFLKTTRAHETPLDESFVASTRVSLQSRNAARNSRAYQAGFSAIACQASGCSRLVPDRRCTASRDCGSSEHFHRGSEIAALSSSSHIAKKTGKPGYKL
jgi:RNA polymerase sigma factor (sigma-70 family)